MSAEEEDLKAFEADLAALQPRADRLDRDRLMFLAGQAAAARGNAAAAARTRRWAWPAALAAMTTVAAALLAVVVWRPEPQVVERIIEAPVERPAPDAAAPGVRDATASAEAVAHASISSGPDAAPATTGWLAYADRTALRARAPYAHALDLMLARGVDSWPLPQSTSADNAERASAPMSNRQLLETLLEGPASGRPAPGKPSRNPSAFSGGDS
jgi:hypothetical protein